MKFVILIVMLFGMGCGTTDATGSTELTALDKKSDVAPGCCMAPAAQSDASCPRQDKNCPTDSCKAICEEKGCMVHKLSEGRGK